MDLEKQVLVDELRKYQVKDVENSSATGVAYILATLLVIVIVMSFMQGQMMMRSCRRIAKRARRAGAGAAGAAASFLGIKSGFFAGSGIDCATSSLGLCTCCTNAWNEYKIRSRFDKSFAKPGGVCSELIYNNACKTQKFTACKDAVKTIEELGEWLNDPMSKKLDLPADDRVYEDFIDINESLDELVDCRLNSGAINMRRMTGDGFERADSVENTGIYQAFQDTLSTAQNAAAVANTTSNPTEALKAATTALDAAKTAVAATAVAPAPLVAPAAENAAKTIESARSAVEDAVKTSNGQPKDIKVIAKTPEQTVTTNRSTKILRNNEYSEVYSQGRTGMPETIATPNIYSYDVLEADQYSALLVNEVADQRTIANHQEWVKEVGKMNTLPLNIMRDSFDISNSYHGRGTYGFAAKAPKKHYLIPVENEM